MYCTHFTGDWPHNAARCRYQEAALPRTELNCIWFGADLNPGVLFGFPYNYPPDINKLVVLREPATWGWKLRKSEYAPWFTEPGKRAHARRYTPTEHAHATAHAHGISLISTHP